MINDQDRRAIETMIYSGLELKALYAVFPKISREAIENVYKDMKADAGRLVEMPVLKCNCS